jgi:16S rRNA (cytosine967-C5)-methyltransferase
VAVHASIFETVNVTNELNKSWAKKLVNAILWEINRQKSKLQKQIHYSHPTWLLKKIKQYYPNDFTYFIKLFGNCYSILTTSLV